MYMDDDSESGGVAEGLRARGVDVVRSTDVGMRGAPDPDHLAYAFSERRVLYTANRGDFARLHYQRRSEGISHAGIIIRNVFHPIGVQVRTLMRLQGQYSQADMMDMLYWVGANPDL